RRMRCAAGEDDREGGILLMVLLDAALHLVYELPYRCQYAHRRLARLGSPRSWSPHGADRAALPSASRVSQRASTPAYHWRLRSNLGVREATKIVFKFQMALYGPPQEEAMMASTAMLSELYGAFRRKVRADEPPAKAAAEAVVIEDTRSRSIDGRFDALSHTIDQRFNALSQRFDVLNQPFDGLSRAMDKRFDALGHAMDQRSDVLTQAMDQRFGEFGQAMGQRFDALSRMIDERFATVNQRFAAIDRDLDVLLVRLETKTATVAGMDAQLARLETNT